MTSYMGRKVSVKQMRFVCFEFFFALIQFECHLQGGKRLKTCLWCCSWTPRYLVFPIPLQVSSGAWESKGMKKFTTRKKCACVCPLCVSVSSFVSAKVLTLLNKTLCQLHTHIIQQGLRVNKTAIGSDRCNTDEMTKWEWMCPSDIIPLWVCLSVSCRVFCLLWFPPRDKSVKMMTRRVPLVTRQDFHSKQKKNAGAGALRWLLMLHT